MTSQPLSWGVIAHVPNGLTPEDDEAHFDGWYADQREAEEVFMQFVETYPTAIVHLVKSAHCNEWRDPTQVSEWPAWAKR